MDKQPYVLVLDSRVIINEELITDEEAKRRNAEIFAGTNNSRWVPAEEEKTPSS